MMFGRLTRLLIAFIVAIAVTVPAGARPVPMRMAMVEAVMMHCPDCSTHSGIAPAADKMPGCSLPACADAAVVLPVAAPLPMRAVLRIPYPADMPSRAGGTSRLPDPFPPRSIALV